MKRIEFIAPVEAMRGNLSGAQDLKYPTQDNKAYDGPVGNVNYARNYTPRFVGAKIASNARKYFTTRTKSANHLTAKSKKAMAVMGGAGAMIASILRDKTAAVYTGLQTQWIALQGLGDTRSFRKYLSDGLMEMLSQKASTHVFSGPASPVTVQNPWVSTATLNVPVSQLVLIKFWGELAVNGIYFYAAGEKAIAHTGDTFNTYILGIHNTLNLITEVYTGGAYLGRGDATGQGTFTFLIDADGNYLGADDTINAANYSWTDTEPED